MENSSYCPNCYSPVVKDADTCPNCKIEFYFCSNCNSLVLESDTICKKCNSDLEDEHEEHSDKLYNRRPKYEYKPLDILTNILIILLYTVILLSVINIYSDIKDISYLNNNYESGGVLYYDESSVEYFLISISQLLYIIIFFVFLIIYFIWIRQAYRNLHSLQLKPTEYSSGWTIGAYFVPFLNLVRPYTMMKEIWYGSQPIADATTSYNSARYYGLSSSGFLKLWWVIVLFDQFITSRSLRFGRKAESYQQILVSHWMDVVSGITGILVGIILLYLVQTVNE